MPNGTLVSSVSWKSSADRGILASFSPVRVSGVPTRTCVTRDQGRWGWGWGWEGPQASGELGFGPSAKVPVGAGGRACSLLKQPGPSLPCLSTKTSWGLAHPLPDNSL